MIEVFKFGGASIKDSNGFNNVRQILAEAVSKGDSQLLVVVSALGKTTNALEAIHQSAWNRREEWRDKLIELELHHFEILSQLGFERESLPQLSQVFSNLQVYCSQLGKEDVSLNASFDSSYDKVVSLGEILSSLLLEKLLSTHAALQTKWLDAREIIVTDSTFRAGKVESILTHACMLDKVKPLLEAGVVVVTQGFIGRNLEGDSTTLGREGSDYSGALFASSLGAKSLTIWKDVPGVLSADPRLFPNPAKYARLSYQQAAEMTYYGATVIHPKTIKPLADKGIPLIVKSFLEPKVEGTLVGPAADKAIVPAKIVKRNQVLISLTTKDLAFSTEIDLIKVLQIAFQLGLSINMMQNSAVSISIVVDANLPKVNKFRELIGKSYSFHFNDNLELITVKYYDDESIRSITDGRVKLLVQQTRTSYQVLLNAN